MERKRREKSKDLKVEEINPAALANGGTYQNMVEVETDPFYVITVNRTSCNISVGGGGGCRH